jgi:hypothetical protein
MTASKQHFEMIARAIRETGTHEATDRDFAEGWHAALSAVAVRLADECTASNPRFNRDRFLAACHGRDSIDSAGSAVKYSQAPGA